MVLYLGKYRDSLCIVAAILESANSGASKTRIMYQANLSFSLLEKYLDVAVPRVLSKMAMADID